MKPERFNKKYPGLRKHTRAVYVTAKKEKVGVLSLSYDYRNNFVKVKYRWRDRIEVFWFDAFGFVTVTRGRCRNAIARLLKKEV
jgi:hypothetical protein